MAKISKSAIERRLVLNSNEKDYQPSKEEISEAMLRKFKKETKRELILDEYRLHQYYMTKKERRIAKARLHSIKF